MRFEGVHHVEFSVLDYDESIKFFDKMFGWLGYKSFWTAKTGGKLNSSEHQTGIHHIALWAKSRKEMDLFYQDFLKKNNIDVTDTPAEYSTYTPGYYAVFFNDPITGIHFELAYTPFIPSFRSYFRWLNILKGIWKNHPEWKEPPWKEAMRKLPSKNEQA